MTEKQGYRASKTAIESIRGTPLSTQLTFEPIGDLGTRKRPVALVQRPFQARRDLDRKYAHLIEVNHWLDRSMVSFQANKSLPFYRWFKYREGFAAPMVSKVLSVLGKRPGSLLDPFAGAGSALFAARSLGWATTGIELLPSAVFGIRSRLAAECLDPREFESAVDALAAGKWLSKSVKEKQYNHIRITSGAFSSETEDHLNAYLSFVRGSRFCSSVKQLLRFAAYCVLEDVSFTRKDGQYLRWDHRSGRQLGIRQFDKGRILPFFPALLEQLSLMVADLKGAADTLFPLQDAGIGGGKPTLIEGSCLDELPNLSRSAFDCIFTSPPYCNRYDYTRTYALELAFLGSDEQMVKDLRQRMLFCTVENKEKADLEAKVGKREYASALVSFQNQDALQEVLCILDALKLQGALNNPGIAKLVRNYFVEMNLVIRMCARVLRKGGHFVMVNDNVRYAGETVPVDTILSEFAAAAGMQTLHIWKLGTGKGNSSQQMGEHGREELRKSICVWRKS